MFLAHKTGVFTPKIMFFDESKNRLGDFELMK